MEYNKKNLETVLKNTVIPFVVCVSLSVGMYIEHNYKIRIYEPPPNNITKGTLFNYTIDIHKKTDFEKEYRKILED